MRLKPRFIAPAAIKIVAGALGSGQVLVLPTDTIYGLSCRADDARAVRRIQRLKGRSGKKPFIILVSSLAMLRKYAVISEQQSKQLAKIWRSGSRPTTVILAARQPTALALDLVDGSLAARLPKSEFLIKIIKTIKAPIVSTSLNRSGQTNIRDPRQLAAYLPIWQQRLDLVVDGGICRRRRASRIIDLRDSRAPRLLRK
ncbi:MAG: L-threonylcarbamoyladenylate synthase [Patescibacteria group bacterium]